MGNRKLLTYLSMQGWMIRELSLDNKNELLVYAAIFSFSQDGKSEYRGGRQYLADSLSMTLSTLDRSLDKLVKYRYIFKETTMCGNTQYNTYRANLKQIEEFLIHDPMYMEKYSQNDYSQNDYCIQNDDGYSQNDEHIIKDNNKKVEGKPSTPAKLDKSNKHPRNFSKATLTDELNSLGELEEKELQRKEKQKSTRKKTLYDKCIDEIANPVYCFSADVQQKLKDFLPTTLQANEYAVKGINQWIYRLKSLVELSKDPAKQIEIIEYSISHSITGFVYGKKNSQIHSTHECFTESIHSTPIEEARAAMEEKRKKGVQTY